MLCKARGCRVQIIPFGRFESRRRPLGPAFPVTGSTVLPTEPLCEPHINYPRNLVEGKSHVNSGLLFSKMGGLEALVAIVDHCHSHRIVASRSIPQPRQTGSPAVLLGG